MCELGYLTCCRGFGNEPSDLSRVREQRDMARRDVNGFRMH